MFCPQCGKEIVEGQAFCKHCGASLAGPAPGQSPAEEGRQKTPWEDRENIGFLKGFFTTAKNVLFSPSVFFKKMPVQGGLIDPLLFALILGMTGFMFLYFWDILLHDGMRNFMTPEMKAAAGQYRFQGIGLALLAFLAPVLIIIGLFILSGILHVFLMMVNGARAGFEATFRVVAYGYSINIFFVAIPVCGIFIAGVWAIVLMIIGLKEAHQTTGGKAAVAVFSPFLVCCGLLIAASLLFMGAIAASFGAMMQMHP